MSNTTTLTGAAAQQLSDALGRPSGFPGARLMSITCDSATVTRVLDATALVPEQMMAAPKAEVDECAGCHFCTPWRYPKAARKSAPKLPRGHIIYIEYDVNGGDYEHKWTRIVGSYESATKAILEEFREDGPALTYWKKDCYDDDDHTLLKKPTLAWACKKFNPTALSQMDIRSGRKIYGPYIGCRYRRPNNIPFNIYISLKKVE